MIKIKMKNLDV